MMRCLICGSSSQRAFTLVLVVPGATALTRLFARAYSSAAAFVSPTMPCLLAMYGGMPAPVPTMPTVVEQDSEMRVTMTVFTTKLYSNFLFHIHDHTAREPAAMADFIWSRESLHGR